MRIVLVSIVFIISQSLSFGQSNKTCCNAATQEFAMLGSEASFRSAHDAPEPMNFNPTLGTDISFEVATGLDGRGFLVKAEKKSNKYLFVFHEWWGLNNYIRKECEKFALILDDVNIIALDLYDGKTATNREDASELMQQVEDSRAREIIKGALKYVGENAEVQSIGWCFGGGWSLQSALIAGTQSKGCVIYYGMPEKDENKLKTLHAPVLGIFASNDGWINHEVVDPFEASMKEINKPLTIKWYDADHAFANPSNPKFNSDAANDANSKAQQFLKTNFAR